MIAPVSSSGGTLPWRGAASVPLVMGGCLPPSVFFFGPSDAPLTEVLLRLPLSVDLLGLFPPPGVLRVAPESRGGFPWVVTFLFPEGRLLFPMPPPKVREGLKLLHQAALGLLQLGFPWLVSLIWILTLVSRPQAQVKEVGDPTPQTSPRLLLAPPGPR